MNEANQQVFLREQNTRPDDYLNILKEEIHEMSEQAASIQIIGEVRGESNPGLWIGVSSLANRVASGELSEKLVEDEIQRAGMCYIKVAKGAAKRCVEDRTREGYDDANPIDYAVELGPQFQGGTPDEALAYRLANNPDAAVSIVDDTQHVIDNSNSVFAPGAHTGTYQNNEKTDCGAVDNADTKINLAIAEQTAPIVEAITTTLINLGKTKMPINGFAKLQDAVRTLALNTTYFSSKSEVQNVVKKANPKGVSHVVGDHKQIALIVNLVPDETFHTDHFNAGNNSQMTIHNLDLWNVFAEYPPEEQIALCMQAVTTLMKITDGSLKLVIRSPK